MLKFPTLTTLALVKKRYCEDKQIPLPNSLSVEFLSKNQQTGDSTFYIEGKGGGGVEYVYTRRDLSGYSSNLSLRLPREYYLQLRNNPLGSSIATWVNRHTNIDLNEEDIAKVLVSKTHVDVIIVPDSMRFKNDFRLAFI